MSKLLSSLIQSEPHPSAQSLAQGGAGDMAGSRTATISRAGSSRRVAALCFAVPVIGVLVYAGIYAQRVNPPQAQPEGHVAAVTEMSASTQAESVRQATSTSIAPSTATPPRFYPAGTERLAYPELYTEPLPRLHSGDERYAVPHSTSESIPALRQDERRSESSVAPVPEITTVPSEASSWDLEEIDYSELSPELASHLRSAIAATGEDDEPLPQLLQEEREGIAANERASEPEAIAIGELPVSVQNRIPKLNFQTHIYSSAADSRWIKVNGREAFEGDEIAPGVVLRHIKPRTVVFGFDSYLISMPALSEW